MEITIAESIVLASIWVFCCCVINDHISSIGQKIFNMACFGFIMTILFYFI